MGSSHSQNGLIRRNSDLAYAWMPLADGGHRQGLLWFPMDLLLIGDHFVVADTGNFRIQVFDKKGNFIASSEKYCAMDHPWKLLSSNDSNHFVLIDRNLVSEWELLPYAEWKFKPICTLLPEPSSQKDYATLHSNGNAFALAHACAHACEEKNNGVSLDTAFLQQRAFVESLKGALAFSVDVKRNQTWALRSRRNLSVYSMKDQDHQLLRDFVIHDLIGKDEKECKTFTFTLKNDYIFLGCLRAIHVLRKEHKDEKVSMKWVDTLPIDYREEPVKIVVDDSMESLYILTTGSMKIISCSLTFTKFI